MPGITGQATSPNFRHSVDWNDAILFRHQQQHGRHKQVHVGEVATERLVIPHEFDGVQVDQEAHAGDYRHHDHGQTIDVEGDSGGEIGHGQPGPQAEFTHLAVCQVGRCQQRHAYSGEADGAGAQQRRECPGHAPHTED